MVKSKIEEWINETVQT